ncbi:MAG: methyltransferase domain-containing protein [Deltaproteobacteria bacterium]|nr:MAG: methyltransferase domain-containing protein [Deltaproteobacteria bacterium]
METVECDFCGSTDAVNVTQQTDKLYHTTRELFNIVSCLKCGLHYTNPRPSVREMGQYYTSGYYYHLAPSRWSRYARLIATKIANSIFAYIANLIPIISKRLAPLVRPKVSDPVLKYYNEGGQGCFLDIGCGAGAKAHFWDEAGSLMSYRRFTQVAGVEVGSHALESLTAAGVEAWKDIAEVPKERRFGVIRMNWSLEHVHSPARYFDFLRKHLIVGGQAIIAVPNYDGLIYRLARNCVELPIHLYHFRPADIQNYAARYDLQIINLCTFSYPEMFTVAAQAGLLPDVFKHQISLRATHAFQESLRRFDLANWGNDMIVVLAHKQ